jgi:signal transduction histidine kinase
MRIVTNAQGPGLEINAVVSHVLGWSSEDLENASFFDLVRDADATATTSVDRVAEGEPITLTLLTRKKDGSAIEVEWSCLKQDRRLYVTGRAASAAPIAQDARSDAVSRLEALETVAKFSGGVAHEFNNLLQNITASLELVKRMIANGRAAETDRIIATATASALRAATLNQKWIALSRRAPSQPRDVPVDGVLADMTELLRHSLPPSTTIEFVPEGRSTCLHCDRSQLETVVLSMVLLTCDALARGGKVTIQSSACGSDHPASGQSRIEIEVCATGKIADFAAARGAFAVSAVPRFAVRHGGEATFDLVAEDSVSLRMTLATRSAQ